MSNFKNLIIKWLVRSIKNADEIDRLMDEMRYYRVQVISPFTSRSRYEIVPVSVIGKYLECLGSDQIEKFCGERIGTELINKGMIEFSHTPNNNGTVEIKATILVCKEAGLHDD